MKDKFNADGRPDRSDESLARAESDGLKQGLMASAILHLGLLSAMILRAVIYPSEPIMLDRAIRVDMVALPEKSAKLPDAPAPAAPEPKKPEAKPKPEPKPEPKPDPKPEPKPEPKPAPKPPPPKPDSNKINLNKAKKNQSDALKRLEALQRIEQMAKEREAEKQAQADKEAADKAKASAPVRGNKVSAGNSLTGMAKLDYDSYLGDLDAQVKRHWSLPEWLANANLKAQIVVWIDARGNVIKKQLVRPSGNPIFDEKVMEAIERASPFPAPPDRLADVFAVDGVRLGFPE